VNIPLVPDKLDLRVSGESARRDGFTTNVITGEKLDDRNYDAYRVSLDAHITDELEDQLVIDGRLINQNGTSAVPTEFNPNVELAGAGSHGLPVPIYLGGNRPSIFCLEAPGSFGITKPLPGCPAGGLIGALIAGINAKGFAYYPQSVLNAVLARQKALGPRQIASDANFFDQERTFDATNITTWEINPDLVLKNIAGYRFNRVNQASDFDGSVLPLVRNTNTKSDWGEDAVQQATDELQLQGNAINDYLKYIVGAYFENSDPGQPTISRAEEFLPPPSYQSNPQFYNDAVNAASVLNYHKFNDKDESVFAHGDWNLGSLLNGLKLATGIRYTWDEREASIDQLDGQAQCVARTQIYALKNGTPICATRQTAEFTALSCRTRSTRTRWPISTCGAASRAAVSTCRRRVHWRVMSTIRRSARNTCSVPKSA
jgi:iron complex outermembrane receptor protein